jgi:hypothetical protein
MADVTDWSIWLTPGAGETLLGMDSASRDVKTRFRIVGKFQEPAFHIGVWVDVEFFQHLTLDTPNQVMKTWSIKPTSCLIRWEFISYIQRAESPAEVVTPTIGFVPMSTSKSN